MRVLHLVSNHKLTGPVDPAICLGVALDRTDVDSEVAVGRAQSGPAFLDDVVRGRGLEPVSDFRLPKHRRLLTNRVDAWRLAERLRGSPVDILHVHLDNAHRIASRARRLLGPGQRPYIVRSLYDDRVPVFNRDQRRLYQKDSDGIFVFGADVCAGLIERFGLPGSRVRRLDGGVMTDRFYPRQGDEMRRRFSIPSAAVVGGIVARIQPHRRYEILFEAFRRVMAEVPMLHLLVLGRGTRAKEIAHDGVARLGIETRTHLPGYVGGDEYQEALGAFDFKIFLVPGSDGTCRAVREAMAMGIPVIVSRRGLLPEIVRHRVDGLVVDDEVEPLAAAVKELATDVSLRRQLGENAHARAHADFSQTRQAERVRGQYASWFPELAVDAQPAS